MDVVPVSWDTEFFGFPIARLVGRPDAQTLSTQAGQLGTRCAYYQCPAEDLEGIRAAEDSSFQLVDIRVVLEGKPVDILPSSSDPSDVEIDTAREDDRQDLRQIAAELSTYSRFACDPNFGVEQAGRLYDRWVDVSLDGRATPFLVGRNGERVLGFITCCLEGPEASLELVGVRRAAAGTGIGTALVARARRELDARGARTIRVTTQGRNVRAVSFYERCGFRVADVSLVYHRWFDDHVDNGGSDGSVSR